MPTYDYKCPKCGTEFQEFQKMSDRPVARCPKCKAKAERQMSAGGGFVFKGSGFYLTDYGRNAHRKTGSEPAKAGASESGGGDSGGGESKKAEKAESKPAESKPEFKPSDVKPKKKKDD